MSRTGARDAERDGKRARARAVMRAFSPFGSMQSTERSAAQGLFDLSFAGEAGLAMHAAADVEIAVLGPPIAGRAEYPQQAGGYTPKHGLEALADMRHGRTGISTKRPTAFPMT